MKTLNLTDIDKSDIKYQIQKFPDGQQNIVITPFRYYENELGSSFSQGTKVISEPGNIKVQIKSRLNNWLDLELITCSVAALRELGVEEIHLYTPYIIGARSDRKFEDGGNNYLKDVICPVINSLNFKTFTCVDPHSDVLEACIKGFRKISNKDLVYWALRNGICTYKNVKEGIRPLDMDNIVLVSPDAGASKKIYKIAEQIGYKGDIITCSKDRDIDGKLTWVNVPIKKEHLKKDIIIIDDICDGGATFNNISAALNDAQHEGKKYLIVTHGIFSKGFRELSKYFDGIYCTNSYKDTYMNDQELPNHPKNFRIKQLNVF